MTTDDELRVNHDFVMAFETLRKQFGYREMDDTALREISSATDIPFEDLRVSRHLRNALAHGEPVNRDSLSRFLAILTATETRVPHPSPEISIARPPFTARAYRVHAWQDPRLEQEMLANGFVSIGGDEIGDLTGVADPDFIRSSLMDSMPDRTARAIALFVGYWRRFLWEARAGDLVVVPTRSRRVAIGEFVGPYFYVDDAQARASHRRPVSWNTVGIDRDVFGPDLLVTLNGQHTVQEFKAYDAVARLQALVETVVDPRSRGG